MISAFKIQLIRSTTIKYIVMILFIVALIVTLITLDIHFSTHEEITDETLIKSKTWIDILPSVTKDIITAIIVTIGIGTIVKIISNNLFQVKKNDGQLKKFGVSSVGSGISTPKYAREILGHEFLNIYPQEIRMLYITGDTYINEYKQKLIECLKHGCTIKILLLSTDDTPQNPYNKYNKTYVEHIEKFYKEASEKSLKAQTETVKKIVDDLQEYGTISIRFYTDEFFYCFRSAKYCDNHNNVIHKIISVFSLLQNQI